jgi:hypothetical protein
MGGWGMHVERDALGLLASNSGVAALQAADRRPMKRNAYLLAFLTFWVQLDDALLTSASTLQSASLPSDDDDECLPLECKEQLEQGSARRPLHPVRVASRAADFPRIRRGLPFEWKLTTPLAPPPLYVFMSLQI